MSEPKHPPIASVTPTPEHKEDPVLLLARQLLLLHRRAFRRISERS
ncbi:hypothetical protein ACTHPH_19965 [Paenibacillus pasadenensis]|uniref:Uncharacterized protein n=1 Tax=Paenibacillus pasadenensis TaxID=217090 RepID=A0A2N5N162_9BACL|nr:MULTISPECIES: hypothetical protein [Paenibacillus]PLT44066.1 hypothetical protein B8V81_2497 [Paenibacillus pasadenensis]QGG54610.1 hypothetical protein GE073_02650 [Paenibacillus sp. B01]